jgi:hypothetical protein
VIALPVACVLALCAGTAAAQDDAAAHANRSAYEAAIKCFVADGIVAGDYRRDGNQVAQAALEAKARESFDIATRAGDALGYSGTRVYQDFGLAQAEEVPRLVREPAYFRKAAAMCKALGLM